MYIYLKKDYRVSKNHVYSFCLWFIIHTWFLLTNYLLIIPYELNVFISQIEMGCPKFERSSHQNDMNQLYTMFILPSCDMLMMIEINIECIQAIILCTTWAKFLCLRFYNKGKKKQIKI